MKLVNARGERKLEHKLYYTDAYKQDFTTKIIKQDYDKDGNLYVVLNETAFYPTGGGQPYDTGTLNDINVINVEEINGEIRHYIAEQLHTEDIEGKINWERRFDHMQQHAAQHILSAAFWDHFNMPTIGFHLGKETVTIDLKTENLHAETVEKAIQTMNEKLLFAEANELLQHPTEIHAGILISKVFTNRSMQEIAKLSAIITEQQEHAITYFVIENDDKLQCILACGKSVSLDMNALLKDALPTIEGKGGGNKKSARGGGKAIMSGDEFLNQLVSSLQSAV